MIFVGGIDGKKKWLDDGKTFSRNYKQGNRVYDSEGVATALSAQPVGGTGGYTSLYLTKGSDSMMEYKEPLTYSESEAKNSFTFVELFARHRRS